MQSMAADAVNAAHAGNAAEGDATIPRQHLKGGEETQLQRRHH
jgi:hypothetical protein